jgi:excinuclease UvrABC nuclease subunit
MENTAGATIYIGKAVNLRRRVSSYANPSASRDAKVSKLVMQISSLSYIETASELEALLVESRLIKARRPVFNRRLLQPESCCYLRFDQHNPVPRIDLISDRIADESYYLGPLWNPSTVHDAVDAITDLYRLRRCSKATRSHSRQWPCVYQELGKCLGPCGGAISEQDYRKACVSAWDSLSGRSSAAVDHLTSLRDRLIDELRFEDAYTTHRQLRAIQQIHSSIVPDTLPNDDFSVVVPSYLRSRPMVLIFSHGKLRDKLMAAPLKYPEVGMIQNRIYRCGSDAADLLPGMPNHDDWLIIRTYLRRHSLSDYLLPLTPALPFTQLAQTIHTHIDAVRLIA